METDRFIGPKFLRRSFRGPYDTPVEAMVGGAINNFTKESEEKRRKHPVKEQKATDKFQGSLQFQEEDKKSIREDDPVCFC